MAVRFVYFDAGNTLIAPHPSVGEVYYRAGVAHGINATPAELQAAFRSAWTEHVVEHGDGPIRMGRDNEETYAWWRRLVGRVFDQVKYSGDREACFLALFDAFAKRDAWRVYDDVLPVLEELKRRNIACGIISNWDFRLPELLAMLDLAHHFDPVLVSALEGIAKPDRGLFELGCRRAGLAAEEIAYVGDSVPLDLEPARAHGMKAFLIDRDGKTPGPHAVRSLLEMLPHL
jgi:REG-2-like HAD superfamily hydrolase